MEPMTMMALGQMGMGIIGGMKGRKASKKARKKQKALIAQRMKLLDMLGAKYLPGGETYESKQKDLRTSQERNIADMLAQRTKSFTKTTTGGAQREKYMARTGRQERMGLESWLSEKYGQTQKAKADVLGGINVQGPSAGSIEDAFSQAGQGLSSLMSLYSKQKAPQDVMGSDITKLPQQSMDTNIPVNPLTKKKMYGSYQGLEQQW